MFAYIIPKPHSVHVGSWPEYRRLAQAGPWSTTAIDGKTLLFRHAADQQTQLSRMCVAHYGQQVALEGGMVFLPPKEPCGIAEFLRPERERPACIVVTLPVGASRSEPVYLHVPIAQAQPRKIKWGAKQYGDEPAGEYYRAAMALHDAGDVFNEANKTADKDPKNASAAYEKYSDAMLRVASLAIPLAYAVTDELMDWGQWIDEGDLPLIALAAMGVDPKKAEQAGESA
jgi:hypothetical protein